MAMGKRERDRQAALWVAATDLPTAASHPFYARLNQLLRQHDFDTFAETQCSSFYAETMGRPGLAPGVYFRLLLVGYFEGIDSERGIAWRAADSLTLRDFLGITLPDAPPDHSTISRTRRLIDLDTHRAIFTWVLQRLADGGLVKGQTIGIDATTLEANAALRSIVRRDTGEGYQEFLTKLAQASGIETPTRADLARLDRKRRKKGANKDWTSPSDPDARITKMKDGRTHLAHKAEHAVDLDTGAIVAVTVQPADHGDTTTIDKTLADAVGHLEGAAATTDAPVATAPEVVADKGYHSRRTILDLSTNGFRPYISEPARKRQHWINQRDARDAVYANRRRTHGARGSRLQRRRGEFLERPMAHLYETGGLRRTHVRGHGNVGKRLLVHAAAFNLGLLMRRWIGVGTPRGLQGRAVAALALLIALCSTIAAALTPRTSRSSAPRRFVDHVSWLWLSGRQLTIGTCTTGC
ncbi:MAG: transposase [Sphingomonadaceae bacterium]|nr:transposase [Sphingomonadaceae bacterium]